MRSVKWTAEDHKRFCNGGKFPDSAPDTEWRWEGQDIEDTDALRALTTLSTDHGLDVVTLEAVDTLLKPHGLEVVWCWLLFGIAKRVEAESALA